MTTDQTHPDFDLNKACNDYMCLSQCTEFTPMTDLSKGYHRTDNQGGSYQVIWQGQIKFPLLLRLVKWVCHFVLTRDGLVTACKRSSPGGHVQHNCQAILPHQKSSNPKLHHLQVSCLCLGHKHGTLTKNWHMSLRYDFYMYCQIGN